MLRVKKEKNLFLVHGTKDVAKLIFIRLLKMIIFLWANQRYHIAHSLLLTFTCFEEKEVDFLHLKQKIKASNYVIE